MVVPILVASHIIDPLDLEILSGLTGGVVGVGRRWFTASYSLLMKSLIGLRGGVGKNRFNLLPTCNFAWGVATNGRMVILGYSVCVCCCCLGGGGSAPLVCHHLPPRAPQSCGSHPLEMASFATSIPTPFPIGRRPQV